MRPTDHIFTGVYDAGDRSDRLVGQVHHSPKMTSAHLNYLLVTPDADREAVSVLLEGLVREAGAWGVKQIFADLAVDSDLYPQFRRAGFSALAKQRVFKSIDRADVPTSLRGTWRTWTSDDIPAMRRLYQTLIPPLIQSVEPLTRREKLGLVYRDESGSLQAYADLVYGPKGAWVLPIVNPQIEEDLSELLVQMIVDLPERYRRPVYITVRSYQPWVENALESLDLEMGPEQLFLVRYLSPRVKATAEFVYAPIENGKPEPTIPMTPIQNHQE